jgi:pyruvate carboxylase
MWGRDRQIAALDARLDRLAGKVVVVVETVGGMVIGLILRAIPDNLRDVALRELRKSITTRAAGRANSTDLEAFQLEIEEFAQQFLDQIECVARQKF